MTLVNVIRNNHNTSWVEVNARIDVFSVPARTPEVTLKSN